MSIVCHSSLLFRYTVLLKKSHSLHRAQRTTTPPSKIRWTESGIFPRGVASPSNANLVPSQPASQPASLPAQGQDKKAATPLETVAVAPLQISPNISGRSQKVLPAHRQQPKKKRGHPAGAGAKRAGRRTMTVNGDSRVSARRVSGWGDSAASPLSSSASSLRVPLAAHPARRFEWVPCAAGVE